MDNFDLRKYLAEGKLTEKKQKKQGDNDELDDSLGEKNGKKKQTMKQRRADSENMEKAKGKRKYSGDKSKDKVNEKADSKKGNESEQKRMEGAIKDDRDHIKNLKKDIDANERKLARLKKDYKKDVIKEEEKDSEWMKKYGHFTDKDFSDLLKGDNEEEDNVDYDVEVLGQIIDLVRDNNIPLDVVVKELNQEFSMDENKENKPSTKMKVSELKAKIKEDEESNTNFPEMEEEFEGAMDAMVVSPEEYLQDIINASSEDLVSDDYYEVMNAVENGIYSEDEAVELAKIWAREKLSTLNEVGGKKTSTKMKVSELKAKIKEDILAELSLNEKEEVDVDVDVEDEVDVDVEADDIEIEKKGTNIKVEVGLSPEEELIQDSLKAAMDAANSLGNDKLADQIGNTITFFTREYVVGNR
jgi:hypothetical protein